MRPLGNCPIPVPTPASLGCALEARCQQSLERGPLLTGLPQHLLGRCILSCSNQLLLF